MLGVWLGRFGGKYVSFDIPSQAVNQNESSQSNLGGDVMSQFVKLRGKTLSLSILALSIGAALPAFAQAVPQASPNPAVAAPAEGADEKVIGLQEMTVTAQRREQSLQSVPIAVTVMTAAKLDDFGFNDVASLEASIPGLTFTRSGGTLSPYLRGVGTNNNVFNAEPSVATYVDGIYVASNISNMSSFNNIERIEVLKGPQGTLFGRNATGGVIQVVTKDPTQSPEAEFKIGYGNYRTTIASAYAAGGISDNLAADISIYQRDQDEGFGHNLNTGSEIHNGREFSARSKWVYTPSDATTAKLAVNYFNYDNTGDGLNQQLAKGAVGRDLVSTYPGRFNSEVTHDDKLSRNGWGSALTVDHDFGFARLVSLTGYSKVKSAALQDTDLLPFDGTTADTKATVDSLSQEVQLFAAADSKLDWVLGAYFFDANYVYSPLRLSGSDYAPLEYMDIFTRQDTRSYSLYGQGSYEVVDRLTATVGARYTWEEIGVGGKFVNNLSTTQFPSQSVKANTPTWRLGLDYQLTDNVMSYLTYNRGSKSGGYNILSPSKPAYNPEKLDAYEFGLKSTMFDNRLRLNVAAYHYDYSDIQVVIANGPSLDMLNAGAAKMNGLDVDMEWAATKNLSLSGGVGFLKTKYTDYANAVAYGPVAGPAIPIDATGNQLVQAPKFSGSLMANYRIPTAIGDFMLNGAVIRNNGFYVAASNFDRSPAYTMVNASVAWYSLDGKFGLQLWANNLTDAYQLQMLTESGAGLKQVEGAPRTFGLTLSARF